MLSGLFAIRCSATHSDFSVGGFVACILVFLDKVTGYFRGGYGAIGDLLLLCRIVSPTQNIRGLPCFNMC